MAQEIIYTSAPQGLRPGTYGFCTVAATGGMVASFIEKLEALSGYRHLFPPGTPEASRNPVVYSHVVLKINARRVHVLSRIADAGLDYTHRSNKLAHHIALDDNETPAGGPAWLASQPGFLENSWSGAPHPLPAPRRVPLGTLPPQVCHAWEQLTGDAGWAGILAQHAYDGRRPAYVIVPEGADVLALLREAQALLPERKRWDVSFSTCYTKMPAGVDCLWRCVIAGTPEAEAALALRGDLVIDASRRLGPAPEGRLVTAARTGQVPIEPTRPVGPTLDASPEPAPIQLPARPVASSASLVIEDEFAVGPPPMRDGSTPPTLPPPKPIAPPALKRRRSWVKVVSVAAGMLVLMGAGTLWYMLSGGSPSGSSAAKATPTLTDISTKKHLTKVDVKQANASPELGDEKAPPKEEKEQGKAPPADVTSTSVNGERESPESQNLNSSANNLGGDERVSRLTHAEAISPQAKASSPAIKPKIPLVGRDVNLVLGPISLPPSVAEQAASEPTLLWDMNVYTSLTSLRILGPTREKNIFTVTTTTDDPTSWNVAYDIIGSDQPVGILKLISTSSGSKLTFSWLIDASQQVIGEQLQNSVLEATFGDTRMLFLLSEPQREPPVKFPVKFHLTKQLPDGLNCLAIAEVLGDTRLTPQIINEQSSLSRPENVPTIGVHTGTIMKGRSTSLDLVFCAPSSGEPIITVDKAYKDRRKLIDCLRAFEQQVVQVLERSKDLNTAEMELSGQTQDEKKKEAQKKVTDASMELRNAKAALLRLEEQYPQLSDSKARMVLSELFTQWQVAQKDRDKWPLIHFGVYKPIHDGDRFIYVPVVLYGEIGAHFEELILPKSN